MKRVSKPLRFPGLTDYIGSPFAVAPGVPIEAALAEAGQLLTSATRTLEEIVEASGTVGDVISGCVFMLHSAGALIESVSRPGPAEDAGEA